MVGFVVIGPIRDLGSKQPWTLSHKYKKSLSPLGQSTSLLHRGFFSLHHSCFKLPLLLLYFAQCILNQERGCTPLQQQRFC